MKYLYRLFLWLFTAGIILLVAMDSLFTRQRMSHDNGIVCKARIRILDDLDIPQSSEEVQVQSEGPPESY